MKIHSIWEEKIKEPENWLTRSELRVFLQMEGSKRKFDEYLLEIESLENSYQYVFGTLKSNKTYQKVRVIEYINAKEREKERLKVC